MLRAGATYRAETGSCSGSSSLGMVGAASMSGNTGRDTSRSANCPGTSSPPVKEVLRSLASKVSRGRFAIAEWYP